MGEAHEEWYASASLSIFSEGMTTDEMAAAIGLVPDRAPKRRLGPYAGILYFSRLDDTVLTVRPEDHLDDLLARLRPYSKQLVALARRLEGEPLPVGAKPRITTPLSFMVSHWVTGTDVEAVCHLKPEQLAEIVSYRATVLVLLTCASPDDGKPFDWEDPAEPSPGVTG